MTGPINTLVFIYNSFNDPLFQNLVLAYIKTLSGKTNGSFYLITFEQTQYALTDKQREDARNQLAAHKVYWYPLSFHTGKFLLFKKAFDFVQAFILVLRIRILYNTKVIFTLANVAASIGIILKKLLLMKMVVYSYEPHSEFMAELGQWSRRGLKYKILNYLESIAGRDSDYIMTGTRYMVDRLKAQNSRGQLFRAPTAVDENVFFYRPSGRSKVRDKYDIHGKNVFLYIGKFGGLYYTQEIPEFFKSIQKEISEAYFLVVTSNDHHLIRSMFENYLEPESFHITGDLSYEEIKDYISASDFGVSGVPPSPSQKFRSPTKVAEYLLCGLPYLTTSGVAEDDVFAIEYNVGVVVDNFQSQIDKVAIDNINNILKEDKIILRNRCRSVGLNYRSKTRIDHYLEEIYEQIQS